MGEVKHRTGYLERLWDLHRWRYAKLSWTRTWTAWSDFELVANFEVDVALKELNFRGDFQHKLSCHYISYVWTGNKARSSTELKRSFLLSVRFRPCRFSQSSQCPKQGKNVHFCNCVFYWETLASRSDECDRSSTVTLIPARICHPRTPILCKNLPSGLFILT